MRLEEIRSRHDFLTKRVNGYRDPGEDPLTPKRREEMIQEIRWLDIEIQKRPAGAAACLCFALVGCAAGICAGFGDTLSAFVTCFLPIFACHQTLLICGMQWAAKNGWPPEVTVWGPNAVIGVVGIVLFWRVTRR
jgi:lipopolysaccharide export LptBFGC system permease protein LptF